MMSKHFPNTEVFYMNNFVITCGTLAITHDSDKEELSKGFRYLVNANSVEGFLSKVVKRSRCRNFSM